jgi:hypothetical protein
MCFHEATSPFRRLMQNKFEPWATVFSSAFEYFPRAMKVERLGWRYENDFIGIQSLAQRLPSVGFGYNK